ncbi:MAG: hypothetical protein ACO3EP_04935 [Phycisphaerales bacterium]
MQASTRSFAMPRVVWCGLAFAVLFHAIGCSTTFNATGSGPAIEDSIVQSMVGDWPQGECTLLGEAQAMFEFAPASNPGAGVLTFGVRPPGDFIKGRIVEVRITPFDDRPEVRRKVSVKAGDGSLLRGAKERIEAGLEEGGFVGAR